MSPSPEVLPGQLRASAPMPIVAMRMPAVLRGLRPQCGGLVGEPVGDEDDRRFFGGTCARLGPRFACACAIPAACGLPPPAALMRPLIAVVEAWLVRSQRGDVVADAALVGDDAYAVGARESSRHRIRPCASSALTNAVAAAFSSASLVAPCSPRRRARARCRLRFRSHRRDRSRSRDFGPAVTDEWRRTGKRLHCTHRRWHFRTRRRTRESARPTALTTAASAPRRPLRIPDLPQ